MMILICITTLFFFGAGHGENKNKTETKINKNKKRYINVYLYKIFVYIHSFCVLSVFLAYQKREIQHLAQYIGTSRVCVCVSHCTAAQERATYAIRALNFLTIGVDVVWSLPSCIRNLFCASTFISMILFGFVATTLRANVCVYLFFFGARNKKRKR